MLSYRHEVILMNRFPAGKCPVCGEELKVTRFACPGCKAEFPTEEPLSPYDRLTEQNALFLKTFLSCRGSLKDVQEHLNISYPTAKKKLEELLSALGLVQRTEEESIDMRIFVKSNASSVEASDIIRNKLYENGGQATVRSITGNEYIIRASNDERSFVCKELPIQPPYEYTVFNVIVNLLLENGGKARKGNGRNYRLGEGDCTEDTVVGAIAKNYAGKHTGDSIYDPVFVLSAVLEWANIVHNRRGYLELTPEYRALRQR